MTTFSLCKPTEEKDYNLRLIIYNTFVVLIERKQEEIN